MKPLSTVQGMQVISLDSGKFLGSVKDVIFSRGSKLVTHILIKKGGIFSSDVTSAMSNICRNKTHK